LSPLLPRRQDPWLVVEVDGSPAAHGALTWALREAARREATVVAVSVLDGPAGDPLGGTGRVRARAHLAAHDQLEARVLRAIAETGIHGRSRTAVLDRPIFEALTAATRGADLVIVGTRGKTVLRQAVPRPPARRLARGA
jgi:nucleotide-binding universal stress UspA family protein